MATIIMAKGAPANDATTIDSQMNNFLSSLETHASGGTGTNSVIKATTEPAASTNSARGRKRGDRWNAYGAAIFCAVAIIAAVAFAKWNSSRTTFIELTLTAAEKQSVDLKVDGRSVGVPDKGATRIPGDPGRRTLSVRRPGFEPIDLTVSLKPGETKTVKLTWVKADNSSLAIKRLRSQMAKLTKATKQWPPSAEAVDVRTLRSDLIENMNFTLDAADHRETADLRKSLSGPLDSLLQLEQAPTDPALDASVPIVAVLGATNPRLRHWGPINSLAFSPDGTRLYSAGAGVVKSWSLDDGRLLSWRECGHREARISASPDGRFIAVTDGPVLILDAVDLNIVAEKLPVESGQFQLAFSPDSTHVALAMNNGNVELWSLQGVHVWSQSNHAGRIDGIAFTPDASLLATGDIDGRVCIWNTVSGTLEQTLDGHDDTITALSFFESGTKLLVSTREGPLSTWTLNADPPHRSVSDDKFMRASVSSNDQLLATQMGDQLSLTHRETGEELQNILCRANFSCDLAFNVDANRVAFSTHVNTIEVIDCFTGEPIIAPNEHPGRTDCLAVSPDDTQVHAAFAASEIRQWKIESGAANQTLVEASPLHIQTMQFKPDGTEVARCGAFNSVDWIPGSGNGAARTTYIGCWAMPATTFDRRGNRFVVSGTDRRIRVIDQRTIEVVFTTNSMEAHAHCVAITPDGRRLLTIDELSNIHVWDTEKRERIANARWPLGAPLDLAITTDGQRFVAGVNELLVYNLTTLEPEFSVPLEHTRSLSVSPDGRLLAQSDSLGRVHVVDLASQSVLHKFKLGPRHGYINQVEFASDSRHLFTANGNGSIYILLLSEPERSSLK